MNRTQDPLVKVVIGKKGWGKCQRISGISPPFSKCGIQKGRIAQVVKKA